ncbi:hypothetical protein GGI35DRAFT_246621 [Trichoderma velutinum]
MICQQCYALFLPFTGEDQARFQSSHSDCAHQGHQRGRQKRLKSKLTRFSKRRKTLLQKAHELRKDCDVDVYLVVRSIWNNQMWQYSNGYILPPPSKLNTVYLVPIVTCPAIMKAQKPKPNVIPLIFLDIN